MALIVEAEHQWLARTFVEYELLPRLLALPGIAGSNRPPRSWLSFLSERECNLEHMLDEDMPAHGDIPNYLVKDAWHLVQQLQLVSEQGLTSAGRDIAELHDFPSQVRDVDGTYNLGTSDMPLSSPYATGQHAGLHNILAEQLRTCYRGHDGLDITSTVSS